jgi:hypothetical protein
VIQCPHCKSTDSRVIAFIGIKRRRVCQRCETRWTTRETLEPGSMWRKGDDIPSKAPPSLPSPLLVFPVVGKPVDGKQEWGLTETVLNRYRDAYPGVDVKAEAKRALSWILSNPSKRKTYRGMESFLDKWMSRIQDRGGSTGMPRNGANHTIMTPSEYPEFK